jgi:hypothetical protein
MTPAAEKPTIAAMDRQFASTLSIDGVAPLGRL